jgi:aminoacrylate hydrolase
MLVAGLGGAGAFWDGGGFAQRCLEAGLQVILHDHRGTGASSRCDRPYSIASMASDVLALMDHLGIERAALAGHSTGGAIGQVLALETPDRISRLVLSATWARSCAYFRRLFEARLEILERLGFGAYRRHAALVLNPPYWIAAHDSELAAELQAGPGHPMQEHPMDGEITRRRIRAILAHDVLDRLPAVTCPTHVVVAADDAVTPAYHSQALVQAIQGASLQVLPRGGHFLNRAEPEAYAGAVIPFLTA